MQQIQCQYECSGYFKTEVMEREMSMRLRRLSEWRVNCSRAREASTDCRVEVNSVA